MKKVGTRVIKCPRCGKKAAWENNPYRPFCSEKCQQVDLGKWAQGEYFIVGEQIPEQDNEE